MYKYSIELLRLCRNIKFGVWVPISVPSSRVRNVAFSEQLQDTGGVSVKNLRLLTTGKCDLVTVVMHIRLCIHITK